MHRVGVGGCVLPGRPKSGPPKPIQTVVQTAIAGQFLNVKISSTYDKIRGRLCLQFDPYHISYYAIKIRLNLHLKTEAAEGWNDVPNDVDLFERCPIETTLRGKVYLVQVKCFLFIIL